MHRLGRSRRFRILLNALLIATMLLSTGGWAAPPSGQTSRATDGALTARESISGEPTSPSTSPVSATTTPSAEPSPTPTPAGSLPAQTFTSPVPTPAVTTTGPLAPPVPAITSGPAITRTLTPAGSDLQFPDQGLTLRFPAAAVATPVEVSLRPARTFPHTSASGTHLVQFELTAHDAQGKSLHQFSRPYTLTLDLRKMPVDRAEVNPASGRIVVLDEATGTWQRLPGGVDPTTFRLTGVSDHFSTYGGQFDGIVGGMANLLSFQANLQTGSAGWSYPIAVPPGPGGFAPKLALTYSSAIADEMRHVREAQAGWIGMGWNLAGLGSIRRVNDGDTVRFYLVLGGVSEELVAPEWNATLGKYLWRTKRESFYRIASNHQYPQDDWQVDAQCNPTPGHELSSWEVWDRDGTYYRFGQRPPAPSERYSWLLGCDQQRPHSLLWAYRMTANGYAAHLARWDLDYVKNPDGNEIVIDYFQAPGSADLWHPHPRSGYPQQIAYGSKTGTTTTPIVISFDLQVRWATDPGSNGSCLGGGVTGPYDADGMCANNTNLWETHRLNAIAVRHDGQLVRRYDLTQQPINTTSQKSDVDPGNLRAGQTMVLTSIVEKGADGTSALPATSFTYAVRQTSYPANCPGLDGWWPVLTSLNNGLGGTITFTYQNLAPANTWDASGRCRWVRNAVTQRTWSDGLGTSWSQSFSYIQGPYAWKETASDYLWAEYRGWRIVGVTEPDGSYHEHTFYTAHPDNGDISMATAIGSEDDLENVATGRELSVGSYAAATKASQLARTEHSYDAIVTKSYTDSQNQPKSVRFVELVKTRQTTGAKTATTTYEYNAADQNGTQYGNLTSVKEWGEADPSSGLWYRHTRTGFYPRDDATGYLVNKPGYVNVYENNGANGNGDWKRSTWYTYDGSLTFSTPPGAQGRLTAIRQNRGGGSSSELVDVTYSYDSFGNRTTVTERNGYGDAATWGANPRTTTSDYDPLYHTFPLTITNPLGHPETRRVDWATGQPLEVTDANGASTRYLYDVFQRLREVRSPSEADTDPASEVYTYTTTAVPFQVTASRRYDDGGAGPAQYHTTHFFFDGFGRLIQQAADEVSGQALTNIHYDGRGQKAWESVPRLVQGSGGFRSAEWSDTTKPRTTFTYDGLGRPRFVSNPDGSTSRETIYDSWSRWVVDENRHARRYENDAFGRLIQVREYTGTYPGTEYALTQYSYDHGDALRFVTNAAGQTTELRYDKLGRKTDLFDPDLGHWTYGYDPIGTLQSQTDQKNQTITFFYDALKRLVRKESPAGTVLASYVYDQKNGDPTSYATGHRTSMVDGSGSTKWYYDRHGRVRQEEKTIDGTTYTSQFTANLLDQPRTVIYPGSPGDNEVVTSRYDAATRLSQITTSRPGEGPYLASASYNAQGQLQSLGLSNGAIQTTYGYYGYGSAGWGNADDAPSGWGLQQFGRLWTIRTVAAGQTRQNLQLGYDAVGNVTCLGANCQPSNTAGSQRYEYDALDRLTRAYPDSDANGFSETFSYDTIGNVTSQDGVARSYDPSHSHAVSTIGSTTTLFNDPFSSTANWTPLQSSTWTIDGSGRASNSSFANESFGSTANWTPQTGSWSLEGSEYHNQSLLQDDFASNASNWQPASGSWAWDGSGAYRLVSSSGWDFSAHSTLGPSTNYATYEATMYQAGANNGALALVFHWQDVNNFYMAELFANTLYFAKRQGGAWSILAQTPFGWSANTGYTLRVGVEGSTFKVSVNGTQYLTVTDGTFRTGRVALGGYKGTFTYDNVTVSDWHFSLYSPNNRSFNGDQADYLVDTREVSPGADPAILALVLRWQDVNNHYQAMLWGSNLVFYRKQNGVSTRLGLANVGITRGVWNQLRVHVEGTTYTLSVNGTPIFAVTDGTFTTGKAGLASYGGHVHFDNFIVRQWEYASLTNHSFGDGEIQVDLTTQPETGTSALGLGFRWQDQNNFYLAEVWDSTVFLLRRQGGVYTTLASTTWTTPISTLRVRLTGNQLALWLQNGSGSWVPALTAQDWAFPAGTLGLASWGATNTFDNLTVTELPQASYVYDANGNLLQGGGRTLTWDVENRLTQVETEGTTTTFVYDGDGNRVKTTGPVNTFADGFEASTAAWTSTGYQTVPVVEQGQYTLRSTGSNTNWDGNFYRSSSSLTSGQEVRLEFKVDRTDTDAHFSIESETGGIYRRWGVIAGSGKAYVQLFDGSTWSYPQDLLNPLKANTWYVVRLRVDDATGFQVVLAERDNPAVRGSYSQAMPSGLSWRFHHWIYRGTAYLTRYVERALSQTVLTVGRLYEKNLTTGEETRSYYGATRRLAQRTGSQLTYLLADHLGSTVGVLSPDGNHPEGRPRRSQYFSYGSSRLSSGGLPTDALFTGQRLTAAPGLYDYGARFYDPVLGRFISPDTIVPDPSNPQTLNRYAYANNNPLKYVDRDGHLAFVPLLIMGAFLAYDLYQAHQTFQDPAATDLDKGIAVVAVGLDVVPGGGQVAGKALKVAAKEAVEQGAKQAVKEVAEVAMKEGAEVAATRAVRVEIKAIDPPSRRGGLRYEMEKNSIKPPPGMTNPQVHHNLPWTFKDWFAGEGRGLNVNDPQFGRWVEGTPPGQHQYWTPEYQNKWEQWIEANPHATREQVLDYMNTLLSSGRYS